MLLSTIFSFCNKTILRGGGFPLQRLKVSTDHSSPDRKRSTALKNVLKFRRQGVAERSRSRVSVLKKAAKTTFVAGLTICQPPRSNMRGWKRCIALYLTPAPATIVHVKALRKAGHHRQCWKRRWRYYKIKSPLDLLSSVDPTRWRIAR